MALLYHHTSRLDILEMTDSKSGRLFEGGVVMRRILAASIGVLALFTSGVGGVSASATPVPSAELSEMQAILATADHVTNAQPVALGTAVAQLAERGKVSTQALVCMGNVFIVANANGLAVSAELAYPEPFTGELRARAGAIGAWELFTVCQDDVTHIIFFISQANGLAVSAELDFGGLLRARAGAIGAWEQFVLVAAPPGIAIVSLANGLAVSTEIGFDEPHTGALRARAGAIGPWEIYR